MVRGSKIMDVVLLDTRITTLNAIVIIWHILHCFWYVKKNIDYNRALDKTQIQCIIQQIFGDHLNSFSYFREKCRRQREFHQSFLYWTIFMKIFSLAAWIQATQRASIECRRIHLSFRNISWYRLVHMRSHYNIDYLLTLPVKWESYISLQCHKFRLAFF